MIKNFFLNEERLARPVISLIGVFIVVAALSSASFALFWFSDTKDLVSSIQANSSFNGDQVLPAESIDADGVLSTAELQLLEENIQEESAKLNPEIDFDVTEISEAVIGF